MSAILLILICASGIAAYLQVRRVARAIRSARACAGSQDDCAIVLGEAGHDNRDHRLLRFCPGR